MAYVVNASSEKKSTSAYFNDAMERAAGTHLWPSVPVYDPEKGMIRITIWHVPGTGEELQ